MNDFDRRPGCAQGCDDGGLIGINSAGESCHSTPSLLLSAFPVTGSECPGMSALGVSLDATRGFSTQRRIGASGDSASGFVGSCMALDVVFICDSLHKITGRAAPISTNTIAAIFPRDPVNAPASGAKF